MLDLMAQQEPLLNSDQRAIDRMNDNDARDKSGKLALMNLSTSNQFKNMVAASSKGEITSLKSFHV